MPTARGGCSAPTTTPRGRRSAATSPPPEPNELVDARRRRAPSAGRSRGPASGSRAGRGSATNTRIAYLSGDRLHVVAGDGTGDFAGGRRTRSRHSHPRGARASGSSSPTPARDGRVARAHHARRAASSGPRRRPARRSRSSGRATARQLLVALAGQGLDPRRRPRHARSAARQRPTSPPWPTGPGLDDVRRAPPLGGRKPRHARRAHAVQLRPASSAA